jgi:RNA polymerase sigma-70 factor, ECF subfamily
MSSAPIRVVMTANQPTDNDLVQAMLSGDREAFAELYRRRHPNVYRFALQMTGLRELAEDVTQEVFMVLMREGEQYDARRGSLNSFLLGIARNQVLRRLKRDRPLVTIEEAAETTDLADDQLKEISRIEAIKSLQRAILSLPEHYREVVVLCELQELSYAEAASLLGCAIGTVRSRLHRARAMLAERLRPVENETTPSKTLKSARCFA